MSLSKFFALVAALMVMFFAGMHAENWRHSKAGGYDADAIKAEITATLSRQDAAWNRGDIPAFMEDYIKSDALRFASGGDVKYGWQTTLDGYTSRYPDKAAMGRLAFTDLDITVMSPRDAMVFARWRLTREADAPGGLFTLHMRKIDGAWKIVSDHTSSE